MIRSRIAKLDPRDPYVIYFNDYLTNLRRYNKLLAAMKNSPEHIQLEISREITWTEYAIDRAIENMQGTLEILTSKKP